MPCGVLFVLLGQAIFCCRFLMDLIVYLALHAAFVQTEIGSMFYLDSIGMVVT